MVNRQNRACCKGACRAVKLYKFAEPFVKASCSGGSKAHRLPNTVVRYYLTLNIRPSLAVGLVQLYRNLSTFLVLCEGKRKCCSVNYDLGH